MFITVIRTENGENTEKAVKVFNYPSVLIYKAQCLCVSEE